MRLISNPAQVPSQEYDEIEISVLATKVVMNITLKILVIKKKRGWVFIARVWT